jgi:hypothetical protein
MSRTDSRTLINRGRKAGLKTSELYRALGTRPPEVSDPGIGQADSNGFVSNLDPNGRAVYRPLDGGRK